MTFSEELLGRLEIFGTRLGLGNMRKLLAALGEPQERLSVVLVGGTNGKGSSAALLSSIASAAGYRTGLYTSPHLERVHERLRIDGRSISEQRLSECLERVLKAAGAAGDAPTTYFEALTAAALVYFAAERVDLAVLEVGLGGRLDATNATEPILSLITEIGLDHREHLGDTRAEIAVEKAGILRWDRPALARVTDPEARRAIEAAAARIGARLGFIDSDYRVAASTEPARPGELASRSVEIRTAAATYRAPLSLGGSHQLANASLAVAAAEELAAGGWKRFDPPAIEAGLAACRWPGRLEWVCPGGTGERFLLDGAHNPAAIASLMAYLAELPTGIALIFGALQEKEVERMLPALAAGAERVIVTAPSSPRATAPGDLAALVGDRSPTITANAAEALDVVTGSQVPIVVTGSLYLVGDMRTELRRRFGVPRPAAEVASYMPAGQDSPVGQPRG